MTILTEGRHTGEALLSEAPGHRSRENVTVLSGENLPACEVIGRVLTGGAGVATAYAGNAGSEGAMGAITVTGPAKVGTYRLTIIEPATNAGKFEVVDPDGVAIGTGNVASAFSAGGLAFTLADGGTDYSSGEGFTIAVTGAYKYCDWDPTATDGSQVAVGMIYGAINATSADTPGAAILRDAELNGNCLNWITGADDNAKALAVTQLAKRGIIVRY